MVRFICTFNVILDYLLDNTFICFVCIGIWVLVVDVDIKLIGIFGVRVFLIYVVSEDTVEKLVRIAIVGKCLFENIDGIAEKCQI